MRLALAFAAAAALSVAACAPEPEALPKAPVTAHPRVTIVAEPVPLNPQDPAQDRNGAFRYAGGLVLTSTDTARLHGLSALHVDGDGRLTAISDEGDLLRARLVLDGSGRLIGVRGMEITALAGLDGQPLPGKLAADSEGLAMLDGGDMLVSFEQDHRIWLYPADGGPPRPAPSPQADFPPNGGMEALAADPAAGQDAYIVGGEYSGQTWRCRLSSGCVLGPAVDKGRDFGLVALAKLPDGETAQLLRAWDPLRGNRIVLRIVGEAGEIDRLEMSRPLTVDNFEGLAAVRNGEGVRLYLVSDDNFQSSQRTLLLAFDWRPG